MISNSRPRFVALPGLMICVAVSLFGYSESFTFSLHRRQLSLLLSTSREVGLCHLNSHNDKESEDTNLRADVTPSKYRHDSSDSVHVPANVARHRIHPRREILGALAAGMAMSVTSSAVSAADISSNGFVRAVRPTAYRVDSTIPPTLLPVPTAREQLVVLRDLGKGKGTDKEAVFIDRLNLNNMLQKAVYGTANAVSNIGKGSTDIQAPASFVCLGLPTQPGSRDVELTISLLQSMWKQKPSQATAIGISIFPYTMQDALDRLVDGRITLRDIQASIEKEQTGLSPSDLQLYTPLLEFAAKSNIPLLALGVATTDRSTVLKQGLQTVDPSARALYVVDPEGFIATTTDPAFKLYTDRSLLKDLNDNSIPTGNFFAERILVHEAAATTVAKYALQRGTGTMVAIVAPTKDLRYLNGINGRIPRVFQYLSSTTKTSIPDSTTSSNAPVAPVTANDVTTILLNPTAADTLSRAVRLRLEIGTGPDTLAYQTKIADYLWFSSSPPVNLLPRVMDY